MHPFTPYKEGFATLSNHTGKGRTLVVRSDTKAWISPAPVDGAGRGPVLESGGSLDAELGALAETDKPEGSHGTILYLNDMDTASTPDSGLVGALASRLIRDYKTKDYKTELQGHEGTDGIKGKKIWLARSHI